MNRKSLFRLVIGISMVAIMTATIPLISGCATPSPSPEPGEPQPGPEPTAEEPIYRLRFQTLVSSIDNEDIMGPIVDNIERMSNGRIQFDLYSSCEIVPDDQLLPAVRDGSLDLIHYCAGANPKLTNSGSLEYSLIFGVQNPVEQEHLLNYFGLEEMWREDYEAFGGVHMITSFLADPSQALILKEPIEKVEDVNGLKIVCWPIVACPYIKAGAVPVDIPPDEFYLAGQTGVLDGISWGGAAQLGPMSLHEVFPNLVADNLMASGTNVFVINKDIWVSMPDDLKAIMEVGLQEGSLWFSTRAYHLELVWREKWPNVIYFSPEEHAKLVSLGMECWDDWANETPRQAEIVNIYREYNKRMEAVKWMRTTTLPLP